MPDTNRGLTRWDDGNDVAHSSTFVYYPDLDAGYVVFSNCQGARAISPTGWRMRSSATR
ncbi:MAG TPA: hypothetical protein VFD67_11440 [Gemmatimonadaceae bacterium]|nr:hypothetical protein [Gemmatimonadaceae bacterium]